MKRFYRVAVAGVLAVIAGAAAATEASGPSPLTSFTPQIMPVLVRVNTQGKVTRVSPSSNLSPSFDRLLESNIRAWISKPAMDKGRAIDTEMIVNVALRVVPRPDGRYDANFAYVSSGASPYSSSHWVKIDGTQLALADDHYVNRANSDSMFSTATSFQGSYASQTGSNGMSAGVSGRPAAGVSSGASAHGK